MNFEKFSTWFLLLMGIRVKKVLKLTNLTNRMNNQNHVWAVKIRPKIWKSVHGFIWWYFHSRSWRNMFHSILIFLSWDLGENLFCSARLTSVSHGVQWKKKFGSWWKSSLSWENKWEVWVFILRKYFLTQPTWMEWQILKTQVKSSLL